MQSNELELLSQRIKEAEERLRRVEEENEDASLGEPTPPLSPEKPLPPIREQQTTESSDGDKDSMRERDWRRSAM